MVMPGFKAPYLIDFPSIGNGNEGYISVAQAQEKIPFNIQRIFWTYYTPESIVRGRHAHHRTEQVLIAVTGKIIVTTETRDGKSDIFVLDTPNKGVYIPPDAWHRMQYSHTAVQLVLASTKFDESDYIRDYEQFKHNVENS